jgi:hypothetical protein
MRAKTAQTLMIAILVALAGMLLALVLYAVAPSAFTSLSTNAPAQAGMSPAPSNPTLAGGINPGNPTGAVGPNQACPPCTLLVDSWRFQLQEVHSDPSADPSERIIVLVGTIQNIGTTADVFTSNYVLLLRDSKGTTYKSDDASTRAAQVKYRTAPAGGGKLNPGERAQVAYGYIVVAGTRDFQIVPGAMVASWGGNGSFSLP